MRNLVDIGVDFGAYLASVSPQVKDKSLQWYLSGSLATMVTAGANKITEITLDQENNIEGETNTKSISEEQRKKLEKFSRKLGLDIDVVNVNGEMFSGAPIEIRPHIQNVKNNIPDVLDLMSWKPIVGGSMYIDNLEIDREIKDHFVARVDTEKGTIYVTAPPEQLAHKLSETVLFCEMINEETRRESTVKHYEKDIRDLALMFYGFKDLYEKDELLDRVYKCLAEKNDFFSLEDNSDTLASKQKALEEKIIPRIIHDTQSYLQTVINAKKDIQIGEFLESLLTRRKFEKERQGNQNKTLLQQKEEELSSLKKEEKELIKLEELINKSIANDKKEVGE